MHNPEDKICAPYETGKSVSEQRSHHSEKGSQRAIRVANHEKGSEDDSEGKPSPKTVAQRP